MATIIKVDGSREEINPSNGKTFSLEEAQKAIGGYVQIIKFIDKTQMLFVEDGSVRGLKINESASDLLQSYSPHKTVPIVGDVLICKHSEFR